MWDTFVTWFHCSVTFIFISVLSLPPGPSHLCGLLQDRRVFCLWRLWWTGDHFFYLILKHWTRYDQMTEMNSDKKAKLLTKHISFFFLIPAGNLTLMYYFRINNSLYLPCRWWCGRATLTALSMVTLSGYSIKLVPAFRHHHPAPQFTSPLTWIHQRSAARYVQTAGDKHSHLTANTFWCVLFRSGIQCMPFTFWLAP